MQQNRMWIPEHANQYSKLKLITDSDLKPISFVRPLVGMVVGIVSEGFHRAKRAGRKQGKNAKRDKGYKAQKISFATPAAKGVSLYDHLVLGIWRESRTRSQEDRCAAPGVSLRRGLAFEFSYKFMPAQFVIAGWFVERGGQFIAARLVLDDGGL